MQEDFGVFIEMHFDAICGFFMMLCHEHMKFKNKRKTYLKLLFFFVLSLFSLLNVFSSYSLFFSFQNDLPLSLYS